MSFPDTKYMGSKQAILPTIIRILRQVDFSSVLDAFSGSACVSYALKMEGKRVVSNDFLRLAFHIAKATVENDTEILDPEDIRQLVQENPRADDFIARTFSGLYFTDEDYRFLDTVYANIQEIDCEAKRSLALASLCRACMKKRPRGIFTFTGRKGWDSRRDLKLGMFDQFVDAANRFSACVFPNGRENKALCLDAFQTDPKDIDLVYIDTPYLSPHSDSDYTRRYHFVEGLCTYWHDVEIQNHTVTKKIKSYPTAFRSPAEAETAFPRLFQHFEKCKLAVSYSSNGIPTKERMVEILKLFKREVVVHEIPHRYSFGNHRHKVGDNNNLVTEYLFVAT